MMQDLVGIVRVEGEMERALEGLVGLNERALKVGVSGHRECNPGWHTALDLPNLLTVSDPITRCAIERRESRGGHFRDDYPAKESGFQKFNLVVKKGSTGEMELRREPVAPMSDELAQIIEENK